MVWKVLREIKYLSMAVGITAICLIFLFYFAFYVLPLVSAIVDHSIVFIKNIGEIEAMTRNGI